MPSPRFPVPRLLLLAALLSSAGPGLAQKPARGAAAADPMEASLQGEFALQAGQLGEAARHYLAAARAADDPVLAERATRIALLADEDALARDAYATWVRLAQRLGQPVLVDRKSVV